MVKSIIKKVSAGTLGYIIGGTRGAYYAQKYADNLPEYMAPNTRSHSKLKGKGVAKRSVSRGRSRTRSIKREYKSTATSKHRSQSVLAASKKHRGMSMVRADRGINISQHNDLSIHTVPDIVLGNAVAKGKQLGNFHYMNNYSFIQNKNEGFQAVDVIGSHLTRDIIIGNLSAAATNRLARETLADDLFLMNPWSTLPGNAYFTSVATTVAQDRIFVKNVHLDLEMLSMENVPQMVDIYLITPKFDSFQDPIASWAQSLTDVALGQGSNAPSVLRTVTTATSGKQSVNTYGVSPDASRIFRKTFNVLHCKSVILQPGDQYNLRYNIIYNKMLQKNLFSSSARFENYLKGWTVTVMAVTKGGLVGMTNAAGTGASEVCHANIKVGYALNYKYNLSAVPTSRIETARVYEGLLVGDTTEVQQKLDDTDQVKSLNLS